VNIHLSGAAHKQGITIIKQRKTGEDDKNMSSVDMRLLFFA